MFDNRRDFLKKTGKAIMAAAIIPYSKQVLSASKSQRKTNFILINIDDLGYSDIEPFGSETHKTPNLNQMAAEGMKFTSFYSAASVCTPSRAGLMTGCYPKRVGLGRGSWGVVLFPKDPHGLNPEEKTIAEILKKEGYSTGCFGKWHLGDQHEFLPVNHGFDTYFGIPYSHDMWPKNPGSKNWKNGCCPLPVLQNDKVVDIVDSRDDQARLCKRFTNKAIEFIQNNKDNFFFVYLPHCFIHNPQIARQKFMERAGGDARRAVVEEVDWSLGRIRETLKELNLVDNTLVIFTSDNGGGGRKNNNKPLRGGKGSTWEGGMRVPTIACWSGKIPAGSTCNKVATHMDFLPTLAALAGGAIPQDRVIDGKNITSLLFGDKSAESPYEAFFYYNKKNELEAVRSGNWKLFNNGQLYNLKNDISEQHNVAENNSEIVTKLQKYFKQGHNDLENPDNCRPPGKANNPQYLVKSK
jgi:arylsulfatase A-like enzyme